MLMSVESMSKAISLKFASKSGYSEFRTRNPARPIDLASAAVDVCVFNLTPLFLVCEFSRAA